MNYELVHKLFDYDPETGIKKHTATEYDISESKAITSTGKRTL